MSGTFSGFSLLEGNVFRRLRIKHQLLDFLGILLSFSCSDEVKLFVPKLLLNLFFHLILTLEILAFLEVLALVSIIWPIEIIQAIADVLEAFDENKLELLYVILKLVVRNAFNVVSFDWNFLFLSIHVITQMIQIYPTTACSGVFFDFFHSECVFIGNVLVIE